MDNFPTIILNTIKQKYFSTHYQGNLLSNFTLQSSLKERSFSVLIQTNMTLAATMSIDLDEVSSQQYINSSCLF